MFVNVRAHYITNSSEKTFFFCAATKFKTHQQCINTSKHAGMRVILKQRNRPKAIMYKKSMLRITTRKQT
jgi:oxalate decarboxylase/phosphoglucose isomerase-like protein (cupin superfamily)